MNKNKSLLPTISLGCFLKGLNVVGVVVNDNDLVTNSPISSDWVIVSDWSKIILLVRHQVSLSPRITSVAISTNYQISKTNHQIPIINYQPLTPNFRIIMYNQAKSLMDKSCEVFHFEKVYSYPVYDRCCEVGQNNFDFCELVQLTSHTQIQFETKWFN